MLKETKIQNHWELYQRHKQMFIVWQCDDQYWWSRGRCNNMDTEDKRVYSPLTNMEARACSSIWVQNMEG